MDVRLVAAQCLYLDGVTLEVVRAMANAGVSAVLLKGRGLSSWLYDDGAVRPSRDVDLLVSPRDFARGEEVLATLGFAPLRPGLSKLEETDHARVWSRQTELVDLHDRLWGVGVAPTKAWDVLTRDLVLLPIGSEHVPVLGLPARALHVALHAAQHGANEIKPLDDLARASTRVPFEIWKQAAALARELGSEAAMAAGLRLDPSTAPLVEEFGLPQQLPLAIALHAQGAPPTALGLGRVLAADGLDRKVAMLARRIVPSPARMRSRYPFCDRSRHACPRLRLACADDRPPGPGGGARSRARRCALSAKASGLRRSVSVKPELGVSPGRRRRASLTPRACATCPSPARGRARPTAARRSVRR